MRRSQTENKSTLADDQSILNDAEQREFLKLPPEQTPKAPELRASKSDPIATAKGETSPIIWRREKDGSYDVPKPDPRPLTQIAGTPTAENLAAWAERAKNNR